MKPNKKYFKWFVGKYFISSNWLVLKTIKVDDTSIWIEKRNRSNLEVLRTELWSLKDMIKVHGEHSYFYNKKDWIGGKYFEILY